MTDNGNMETIVTLFKSLNKNNKLKIRKQIHKIIKKEAALNKRPYNIHKKSRDLNLHFIRTIKSSQWEIAQYHTPTFKPNETITDVVCNQVPQIVWGELKPVNGTTDSNIYIVYLPVEGIVQSKIKAETPIVYVGEVRKNSTGFYNPILTRFDYSGNNHGAEERKILTKANDNESAATRIDPYLAAFDFSKQLGFVFITQGIEKTVINDFKEKASLSKLFTVVNK